MSASINIIKSEKMEKKPRERIGQLEMRPKDEWFICSRNERGQKVWHLRFAVTGMFPRLYGPFMSKRKALLFLDRVVNRVLDFSQEFDDYAHEFGRTREFERLNWGPLIEHPLLSTYPTQTAARGAQ